MLRDSAYSRLVRPDEICGCHRVGQCELTKSVDVQFTHSWSVLVDNPDKACVNAVSTVG